MYKRIILNKKAFIAIPHYLLIIIILLAVLTPLLFFGAVQIQRQTQINQLKQDLETMITSAELLSMYSNHASTITKDITIPQSVRYVSFESINPVETNESRNGSFPNHTYHICYDNGDVESFHSPVGIHQQQPELNRLYQGTHHITIEIVTIKDKTYVTMHTLK